MAVVTESSVRRPPYAAIGELVTCSRCGGTWAAAGVNDWLQAGFAGLANRANELDRRATE